MTRNGTVRPALFATIIIISIASMLWNHNNAYSLPQNSKRERFVVFLGYADEEVARWQTLYERSFTDLPTEFAPMIKDERVQLVPAPNMKDLLVAYTYILPELRRIYPDATFVFVVKPSQERDFQIVASMMYNGNNDEVWKAQGATTIDKGFAIVLEDQYGALINTVQHEMMHLIDCGTWHDADGKILPDGKINKYPNTSALAWCS